MSGISGSRLYNKDLAPVPAERRGWGMWHIAALWVGMAVCIPTYSLSAPDPFTGLYTYAWFVSLLVAGLAHFVLSRVFPAAPQSEMS